MKSVTEKIDPRILRLLGLEDVFDLDYDTYLTLLKEAIVAGSKKLPQEELALLANERKRVRGKKGRFKPKEDKITPNKVSIAKFLRPSKKTLALPPAKISASEETGDGFFGVRKTLDSILKTLGDKFKFDKKQSDTERKEKETEKRGARESTLEGFKKGVAGIVATTQKMLSPFQNIIDRIWRFIFFTLLGRAFTKFMEWMSDKKNQEKFNAFIDFLSDHWPALAGLYILFGTGFGKLVRGLLRGVTRMTVALLTNIPRIASFIRKNPRLAGLLLTTAAATSGAVSRQIQDLFADKPSPEEGLIPSTNPELDQAQRSADQASKTRVPQLNVGGMVPKFNLGGMIPSFKMGGIPSPFGMDFYGGVPITGAREDDTLIAAKTGEAILTEKDQQDIGQRYVDRTTGQPLNIPQYLAGRKPGSVAMSNIRFPGMVGGFSLGGMIPKFNNGGIVGGIQNFFGNIGSNIGNLLTGKKAKATQSPVRPVKIPDFKLPEASSLLKTIRTAEHYQGTKNPYNVLYGGGSAPITQMTVKEVIDMYDKKQLPKRLGGTPVNYGSGSGAVGAYQFMPFTLEDLIRRGEVKAHQIMTPELQDKLGWTLARNRGVSIRALKKSGLSQSILDMIAPEWASLPYSGAGGASYYGQPVKGADFLRQIYQQSLPKKQGGGLIKENTGFNLTGKLSMLGSAADRQLISAQPGEFMIPKDSVDRLGTSFFEKLVSMTDSNSDAYLRKGNIRRPQITPYNVGSSAMNTITLPEMVASAGGLRPRSAGLGGGSQVASFSAVSAFNDRVINAREVYGILGVG